VRSCRAKNPGLLIERNVSEGRERDINPLLNQAYAKETAELDPALAALQWAPIPGEPW
jgi:hypothetical protein